MKCVGAIIYFKDGKPVTYTLTIAHLVEAEPPPHIDAAYKRASFKEVYETFETVRTYWNEDGTAKAWPRPWQIHLSTAIVLLLFANGMCYIDVRLCKIAEIHWIAVAVLLVFEIGLSLWLASLLEARIRRREACRR